MKIETQTVKIPVQVGTKVLENKLARLKSKLEKVKALIDEINTIPIVIQTINEDAKLTPIK